MPERSVGDLCHCVGHHGQERGAVVERGSAGKFTGPLSVTLFVSVGVTAFGLALLSGLRLASAERRRDVQESDSGAANIRPYESYP